MDNEPRPLLSHPGGKRTKGQKQADNVSLKHGNSRAYIEARLERDASEGCREAGVLLQAIRDGRITHYAAAVEMGFCRRPEPSGRGSENVTKRNDWEMHKLMRQLKAPKSA